MRKRTSPRMVKRQRIKKRIHKKISGTPERPRLVVVRSIKSIQAQLVDDVNNKTILTVSSLSKVFQSEIKKAEGKIGQAKIVGKHVAEEALKKKIKNVVFDRNGFLYHGRVKAVAEGAREGGLIF